MIPRALAAPHNHRILLLVAVATGGPCRAIVPGVLTGGVSLGESDLRQERQAGIRLHAGILGWHLLEPEEGIPPGRRRIRVVLPGVIIGFLSPSFGFLPPSYGSATELTAHC